MKVLITKKVTLTVEPGSIVEISEGQFKALRDKAIAYKDEAKEEDIKEVTEDAPASKKTSRKKKKSED